MPPLPGKSFQMAPLDHEPRRTLQRKAWDILGGITPALPPTGRMNQNAEVTCHVITSYSIHYTKLYDRALGTQTYLLRCDRQYGRSLLRSGSSDQLGAEPA